MDTHVLEGQWKQMRGEVKERWAELTDKELDKVKGKRDELVGLLQERYGYAKDLAEQEVEEFIRDVNKLQRRAVKKAGQVMSDVDEVVSEYSWVAIGLALALGVVIGLLLKNDRNY